MKPQKVASDSWQHLRDEQRRFRKGILFLVAALILVVLLAGASAIHSWLKLTELSRAYQAQIDLTVAQEAISRTSANRERQNMKLELLELRETISQQRGFADIPRQVDRVLLDPSNRAEVERLAALAVEKAEQAALGVSLNSSTAYLINAVLGLSRGEVQNLVNSDERHLLGAAQQAWINPSVEIVRQSWLDFYDQAESDRMKGLARAGLGLHYYEVSQDAELGLSWNGGCREAVEAFEAAELSGVGSSALALRKGECLRKNGDKLEAFENFFSALKQQSSDDPIHERRLAAHGAGTTLIALEVAAGSDPLVANKLDQYTAELELFPLIASVKLGEAQSSDKSPRILEQALVLLEHAAELRQQRGEGAIGQIYTRENIGFIYIRQQNWDTAIKHAREIDRDMALAWNLTVLIIALEEQADRLQDEGEGSVAQRLREEAKRAREKIALLPPGRLDRDEIEKLLGEPYIDDVEDVYRAMQSNHFGSN
jgi:hypothetical protein